MRGGGLLMLVLLIGGGILAYVWSTHTAAVSKSNQDARQQIAPLTGRGPDDVPMEKSVDVSTDPKGLLASKVVTGGYFEHYYGLQTGDVIVEAGSSGSLKGIDETAAFTFVLTAAQSKQPITVIRSGQKTTLTVK